MTKNIEQVLIEAFEESFSQIPKEKVNRTFFEMNWRGRQEDDFKDWFFIFFLEYRSAIFTKNQQELNDVIDEDWKFVKRIARKLLEKIAMKKE